MERNKVTDSTVRRFTLIARTKSAQLTQSAGKHNCPPCTMMCMAHNVILQYMYNIIVYTAASACEFNVRIVCAYYNILRGSDSVVNPSAPIGRRRGWMVKKTSPHPKNKTQTPTVCIAARHDAYCKYEGGQRQRL